MIKLIKEIFSPENFKKATIYSLLSNPNLNSAQLAILVNDLRNMENKTIANNKTNNKKAA
ncbi:hypothetical protein [Clostridium sp. C2-6-12]|uniref:hypothetical protein n=1 Tax=Clostridium sp. C2-6-12 TaxID=2698832 RepID=UPI0013690A50|nr:hypothetical protein [Clostridium sp. C2-6-12]